MNQSAELDGVIQRPWTNTIEGLEKVDILLKEGEVGIVSAFGVLSELGALESMQCLQN